MRSYLHSQGGQNVKNTSEDNAAQYHTTTNYVLEVKT